MKTLMNPIMKLALLLLCVLSATACEARPLVDLAVVDRDTGSTLQTWNHHGRCYIPGEPGHRYAVRMSNRTGERVLVVLSVDGVNAVTGQTAGSDQAGYVLGPWESAEITGWRKSYSDVAQFVFTALEDSYAARTGRPDNVGVIGIAVFRERHVEPVYQRPYSPPVAERDDERYDGPYAAERKAAPASATAAPAAQAAGSAYGGEYAREKAAKDSRAQNSYESGSLDSLAKQEIGTGHGAREYAPTSETTFERMSSSPQQVSELYYDTAEQLVERGIMPRYYAYAHSGPRESTPRAFPTGFVPDPSW
jgi:hypothetical protein